METKIEFYDYDKEGLLIGSMNSNIVPIKGELVVLNGIWYKVEEVDKCYYFGGEIVVPYSKTQVHVIEAIE